ncbi:unnamed protein product [Rotaria sordida]|uniref:Uncharacterized protein n=1 Tax=Rotaria sordida TaxID=392033 RepID=A0A816D565_9BILA|nr:unnamed protein product [Rotaria sordida]CAF1425501.1 unnamed protein product [Rotaria sordida]CAF1631088.1 unnamed protein product [Rotaria sordida]CAF1631155.1 unnamed protein product [Rotaria sordida]
MMDTSKDIDFDNNDQIRLLTNLRDDIKILLHSHPKGIWFRMLPKVYYMHFNRDIHLDLFAITNPYLFLDYISDIIKFDLPDNLNEEDFIIELNNDQKQILQTSMQYMDLKLRRDVLFKMLQNASFEKRGSLLREICVIDEHLKYINHEQEASPSPKIPVHEQVALRLQKIRSMIDFTLDYLLKTPNEISDNELIELYDNSDEFIHNLTPLAQRLSLSTK